MRIRSSQHYKDYLRASQTPGTLYEEGSSWMWDHHCEVHGDTVPVEKENFKFDIITACRDPLTRQLQEANRIKLAKHNGLHEDNTGRQIPIVNLNRKVEYFKAKKRFDENHT